jgi:hypothetical protein
MQKQSGQQGFLRLALLSVVKEELQQLFVLFSHQSNFLKNE